MDKSNMPEFPQFTDGQAENLIRQSLTNRMDREPERPSTFFAIQDQLNEQDGPSLRTRISGISDLAFWRIVPVSKQRMAQALVLVAIAVVVGSYVAFAGSDDATDSGSAAQATATIKPKVEPVVPETTPIAKLTVPDNLIPFDELGGWPMPEDFKAGGLKLPESLARLGSMSGYFLPESASDESVADLLQKRLLAETLGRKRMQLLVFAPGIDPLAGGDVFEFEPERFGTNDGINLGEFKLSATDPRVIIVEEFAFCEDGRGVYLEHSEKPVEIGETFAWEIFALPGEANEGTFHLVMTAEPDSPITHTGPDPKRIDIRATTVDVVIVSELVEADIKMVGMLAHDPAIPEMCKN